MTELTIEEVRPGILVTEKINKIGGISYLREILEDYIEDQRRVREWQTKSIIDNEKEYQERIKVISRAYSKLRKICANTSIGLICVADKRETLESTINEIQEEIDIYNKKAETCIIRARYGFFEIKEVNHAAVAAIADQIAEVANQVDEAITKDDLNVLKKAPRRFLKKLTPEQVLSLEEKERNTIIGRVRAELIRSAIVNAKNLDTIVPDNVAKEVKGMIRSSRRIARQLCKRVEKRNEAIDQVLEEVDISGIRRTRAAMVKAAIKADKRAREEIQQKEAPTELCI